MSQKPHVWISFCFGESNDERREAFELYSRAFGAVKTWEEFADSENALHLGMDFYDMNVMISPGDIPGGACIHYGDEEELRRTYEILAKDARSAKIDSYPWARIGANVIDKYGVGWWLHTDGNSTEI